MRRPPKLKPYYFSLTIYIELPAWHLPGRNVEKIIKRPRPGNCYTPADLNVIIGSVIDRITQVYPKWEFRLVRVRPDVVRFIYHRERNPDGSLS